MTEVNVIENVKSLQNEVKELQCSIGLLLVQLSEEKLARCTLQNILKEHLVSHFGEYSSGIKWPKLN